MRTRGSNNWYARDVLQLSVVLCWSVAAEFAEPAAGSLGLTNIFAPVSTPAEAIYEASLLVLVICAGIFLVRRRFPGLHYYPLPAPSRG